ncbi:MAG: hypothetical protein WAT79_17390 [Saprospiraceae bacterium]
MNHILLFVFVFLLGHQSWAQIPFISKNNVETLYYGMDNFVTVDMNGCDPELVHFKATKGSRVSKYSDSLYAVYPSIMQGEILCKLYFKNIIVEQKSMTVLPALQLKIKISNEGEGFIKKQDLLAAHTFEIQNAQESLPPHLSFKLISSGVTVINQLGQVMYSNNIRESIFPEALKEIFKKVPSGSRITISNPRIVNNYNQTVQVEPYKEWIIVE